MKLRTMMLISLLALGGCGTAPTTIQPAAVRPAAMQPAPAAPAVAKIAPDVPVERIEGPDAAPAPVTSRLVEQSTGVVMDLLTFNTWGKPGLLGEDEKHRMHLIGPAIQGFDVVTLQETFTRYAEDMGELSGYESQLWVKNGGWFKMKSGLYTLSKHEILESDFAKFKEAATWDRFARKGVCFTRLSVPGVGPVDIYNTHYQSVSKYHEVREHDNSILEGLIKKHNEGHPTFIMGDFNMTSDSDEYKDLMARLPLRDAFAEARPGEDGFTSTPENVHKDPDKTPKRVDYVFILDNGHDIAIEEAEVAMKQLVDGTNLSDHFGVHCRVRVMP